MSDSKQEKNSDVDATNLILNTTQSMLKFNAKTGRASVPSHLNQQLPVSVAEDKAGKLFADAAPAPGQSTVFVPDANADAATRMLAPTLGDPESSNRQFVPAAEGIHDKWIGEPASKLPAGNWVQVEEGSAQADLQHAGTHQVAALSNLVSAPAPSEGAPLAHDPGGHAAAAHRVAPAPHDGAQDNVIFATSATLAPDPMVINPQPTLARPPVFADTAADEHTPRVTAPAPSIPPLTVQAAAPAPALSAQRPLAADEAAAPAPAQALAQVVVGSPATPVHSGATKVSLTAATLERLLAAERATQELNTKIDALSARVERERK